MIGIAFSRSCHVETTSSLGMYGNIGIHAVNHCIMSALRTNLYMYLISVYAPRC